jgi:lysophospholipase L1-like esterase
MRTRSVFLAAVLLASGFILGARAADEPHKPTLFLVGDSTVRNGTLDNGATAGQWGWGHILHYYFDPSRITIINDAMGGTSSRSYMNSPRLWPLVLPKIQKGDFVLIQFGHNDGGRPNIASLKGIDSATTQMAATPARGGRGGPPTASAGAEPGPTEEVHTFGWYLRQYITQIKSRGATPIVCSLIPRNRWNGAKVNRNSRDYALWAQQIAQQESVPFIPLNDLVADKYDQLGKDKVTADLFPPNEVVHPNWAGASINAATVVEGIKALQDCPLKDYLLADTKVPAAPDINPPGHGELGPDAEAVQRRLDRAPATLP